MAIFRYTLTKYLKSPSTWIILIVSMFIAGFLGGYVPMSALHIKSSESVAQHYGLLVIGIGGGLTTFLSIFTSVFAGFKGAAMYKDEVEDGTFLVMLSKPQTRTKILFQKWLALQTLMIMYSLLSVISFIVFVLIFDKGNQIPDLSAMGIGTLSNNIFKMAAFIWAILIVVGLIFSSISLLLSTRLGTGATVGISISLGIIIPITGMVSAFTHKTPFETVGNRTLSRMGMMLDATKGYSDEEMANMIVDTTSRGIDGKVKPLLKDEITLLLPKLKALLQDLQGKFNSINSPDSIYNVAVATGETDKFSSLWGFDFNYQLRQMSSVVTNNIIPEALKPQLAEVKGSSMAGIVLKQQSASKPIDKIVTTLSERDATVQWVKTQIDSLLEKEMEWGLKAQSLIREVVIDMLPKININISISDVEKIIGKILRGQDLPTEWKVPKEITEFLNQSLVKTTLNMVYNSIYHPLSNIFDRGNFKNFSEPQDANLFAEEVLNADGSIKTKSGPLVSTKYDFDIQYKTQVLQGMPTGTKLVFGTKQTPKKEEEFVAQHNSKSDAASKINVIRAWLEKDPNGNYVYKQDVLKEDSNGEIHINPNEYWASTAEYDSSLYRDLLAVAYDRPQDFTFVKTAQYAPGLTLLFIYLGIALFLVPVSFAVVRRQDFR